MRLLTKQAGWDCRKTRSTSLIRSKANNSDLPDDLDVSDENLAYIAGLIDGEGSIYIQERDGDNREKNLRLKLQIANSDLPVLKWVKEKFEMGSVTSGSPRKNCTLYTYQASGHQAYLILMACLPFMKIKQNDGRKLIKKWSEEYPWIQYRVRNRATTPEANIQYAASAASNSQ